MGIDSGERFMDIPTPANSARAAAAPAYVIGHITVRDPVGWQDYCNRVPATLTPFGGEVLLASFHGLGIA